MPTYEDLQAQQANAQGGVDLMQETQEVVGARERFYGRVSLAETLLACGDDRTRGLLIKLFGGVLNMVYNNVVMKEVTQPGSVTNSWEAETETILPVIQGVGGVKKPGVHSDTGTEGGRDVNTEEIEGKIGCGYVQLRPGISQSILDNQDSIIATAQALQPELFGSDEDIEFAYKVTGAHGRLANRDTLFTSGRRVVLKAVDNGATIIVVEGPHVAKAGIYNLVPNTTLDGDAAADADLHAYNHDAWASQEVRDNVHHLYPYDRRHQKIAELIDTIGTMQALGVEEIGVRRV